MANILKLIIFLIFPSIVCWGAIVGEKDCQSQLLKKPNSVKVIRTWYNQVIKDSQKVSRRRKTILKEHIESSPQAQVFFKALAPNYLQDLTLPDPISFTKKYNELLNSLGIPKKYRILPGLAYKKGERFLFLSYGQRIPDGAQLIDKTNDSLRLRALAGGVFLMPWNAEVLDRLEILMIHHDLGHLIGLTSLPYLKALNRYVNQLVIQMDGPRKLKMNKFVTTHLGVYDFLEDLMYIPSENLAVLDEFLQSIPTKNGEVISHQTDVYIDTNLSTDLKIKFVEASVRNGLKRMHQQYLKMRKELLSLRIKKVPDSQIESKQQQINDHLVELHTLANRAYLPWVNAIQKVFYQTFHFLGGSMADGLTMTDNGYTKTATGPNKDTLYFFALSKASNLLSLETIQVEKHGNPAGLDLEDLEFRLGQMINTLIYHSQTDLEKMVDSNLKKLESANATFMSEDE